MQSVVICCWCQHTCVLILVWCLCDDRYKLFKINAIGMYVTVFMYQLLRSCVCGAKDKYIYWVIFGIDMLSKSTSKFFKSRRWVKVLGMRLNCNWGNPHNYFQWIFTVLVANHHTWILILRSSILHAWQVPYQNTTNYKITWHEHKIFFGVRAHVLNNLLINAKHKLC